MREEITGKVNAKLKELGFDALLVFGYHNLQYLSGAYIHLPQVFPDRYMGLLWPREDAATCVTPYEWESSFLNLAWVDDTRTYKEEPGDPHSFVGAITRLIEEKVKAGGKIGVDADRTPLNLYDALEDALTGYELAPCDDVLRELRLKKTPGELKHMKEVISKNDHAIAGQAHHVLVVQASAEMSNTENLRVHAIERDLDEVGHHATAQSTAGSNTAKWWPGAPMYGIGFDRMPKHHEWMKLELVATVNGYWSNGARLLTMDDPTETQWAEYKRLVTLRETVRRSLKPGVKASEVYEAVKAVAEEEGIAMEPNIVLGAGIGVSNYEPPYISAADETVLEPGMVVVFTPVVHGANGELLMNKDTFVVTEFGCEVIGWWKDWREPFIANYTY